ncbi:uncharacterized protein Dwil_GK26766, partial [Drosophila willistoni]
LVVGVVVVIVVVVVVVVVVLSHQVSLGSSQMRHSGLYHKLPGHSCRLSYQEREELYRQTPAVPDERMADAELDNAYELFNLKPQRPTKSSAIYFY